MPALVWPRGVPRFCSFRIGNVRGCGAQVRLEHVGLEERGTYRMCQLEGWLMCPSCFNKMPNLGDDEDRWRHEVHKDDGVRSRSSSASTLPRASGKVKRVLKKPASL
jgi:hypothetical protein